MDYCRISDDVKLGKNIRLHAFVNLYGCEIGDESQLGTFVEIQKHAKVGQRCKVSSHSFICEGVELEDEVFIGHGVMFTNVLFPRATTATGNLQTEADWQPETTLIKKRASIGSGSTILCGVTIGEESVVGAGAVVTRDIPNRQVWAGNPARFFKNVEDI